MVGLLLQVRLPSGGRSGLKTVRSGHADANAQTCRDQRGGNAFLRARRKHVVLTSERDAVTDQWTPLSDRYVATQSTCIAEWVVVADENVCVISCHPDQMIR